MRTLIVNYSLYLFTVFFISCQLKVQEKTYYEDGSILSKVEMKNNQKKFNNNNTSTTKIMR